LKISPSDVEIIDVDRGIVLGLLRVFFREKPLSVLLTAVLLKTGRKVVQSGLKWYKFAMFA
jgi:hypothetical protein